MKRLFSMLLALTMVLSAIPFAAFADGSDSEGTTGIKMVLNADSIFAAKTEEATELVEETVLEEETAPIDETETAEEAETIAATEVPEKTASAREVESFEIPFTVNPVYEGIYTEADFPGIEKSDPASGEDQDHSDLDFWHDQERLYAATYLTIDAATAQLKQHLINRDEAFTLYFKANTNKYETHLSQMLLDAVEHTGKPKEGDYLQWHYAGWGGYIDYFWENGECCFVFDAEIVYSTTAAQEKELDTAVTKLLNSLNLSGKSDYQKIKAVYDYICQNITYDYANLEDDTYLLKYSAYAALVNKTAVCQGYATLFYRLMLELGIDCRVIPGVDEEGYGHAWNIVKIGDVYYNLDATWDAGYDEYYWFLINTWNFAYHSRFAEYETMEFHTTYPMAMENHSEGTNGEADPFIYAGYCGDDAVWVLSRFGEIYISGSGAIYDYDTTLEGLPDWSYMWGDYITAVIVDEGITRIGDYSFHGLENLTTVILPAGVQEIGSHAFTRCYALADVTIGDGLKKIGQYAFGFCSIAKIALPDSLTEIDESAFSGCGLTEIILPDSVEEIKFMTFSGCNKLTKVDLPDNLSAIGNGAFGRCSSLTEIYIPDGVTELPYGVFSECGALTSIRLPDTMESIGECVFEKCTSLTQINLPEKLISIGEAAFVESGIIDLIIPKGITEIGKWTFTRCPNLERVVLPEGLTRIGEEAFYDCAQLKTINLPDSLDCIEYWAFMRCPSLSEVVIPAGITTYDHNIFGGCTGLTSVVLSEGLTEIGPSMFCGCTSLREVLLPNTMEAIAYQAFGNCQSLEHIKVPASVTAISDLAFVGCIALKQIDFEGDAPIFGTDVFGNVAATVYYPAGNATWTEEVMQNYGGTITWVAKCETHDFRNVEVVLPICIEGGYTVYTCIVCGHSYRTDETEKLDHDLSDWVVDVEETCTADGSRSRVCQREGCDFSETEVIGATGHSHVPAVTAPTCTEGGYTTYTCHCGDSYVTDETAALGHDVPYAVETAPTLEAEGKLAGSCTRCGEKLTVTLPKLGKTAYTLEVITEPTKEAEGFGKYTWNVADYGTFTFEAAIPNVILGDVNDDGEINVLDLMYLANFFAKGEIISEKNADVNADGLLDVRDLMFLANVFAGKETLG